MLSLNRINGQQLCRRRFMKLMAASATAMFLLPEEVYSSAEAQEINFPVLGQLETLSSKEIKRSILSIGLETLDRHMFAPQRTYDAIEKLGVKWARLQTGWYRCEEREGVYDFGWLDEVVDALLMRGIQPWFSLGYGNKLYSPEAPTPSAVGFAPLYSEKARKGWTAYVEAIGLHFADRVKCWEIWNEPNTKTFWHPGPASPDDYVELTRMTAPVLRKVIPDVKLIGLVLAGCNDAYFESCMKSGLGTLVDAISFHPYGDHPESATSEKDKMYENPGKYEKFIATARRLIRQYNPALQLWQGECGIHSAPKKKFDQPVIPWNEHRQNSWLLRRMITDLSNNLDMLSYMHIVDLFRYDYGNGPTNYNQHMGLLYGEDYSPKPSYFAYQTLCTLFSGRTKFNPEMVVRQVGSRDDHFRAAGFMCNKMPVYAWWSAVDLFAGFVPRMTTLRVQMPAEAGIKKPVLIDPVTQRVYQLPFRPDAGTLTLENVPYFEYPLLITGRKNVKIHS